MKDTATRDKLLAERANLVKEHEKITLEWIAEKGGEGDGEGLKKKRHELAAQLREGYWELDPYIRARSWYDRTGMIKPGGKMDFYPEKKEKVDVAAVNGNGAAVEIAAADDVD